MKKYIFIGILLITLTHLNYGVGIFVFVASIPFLYYLYQTDGWKHRVYILIASMLAWTICCMKIATDPIPLFMAPMFGIPIGLIHGFGFLLWDKVKNKSYAIIFFPAVMVSFEWIQTNWTPLASWGNASYAIIDYTAFIQSASIGGVYLSSFIIYLINYALFDYFFLKGTTKRIVYVMLIALINIIYGTYRIQYYNTTSKDLVKGATIKTDCNVGGLPLPSDSLRQSTLNKLLYLSKKAIENDASIIVWTEAAAVVLKDEENLLLKKLKKITEGRNQTIVASYVVPTIQPNFQYENKLVEITSGKLVKTYLKHEPVPGEPAIKGIKPITVTSNTYGKLGTGICYDYDYPYIGKASKEADAIALPSSDWKGITPFHTQMAGLRAIENGYSIIRSTRYGTSAFINPLGQMTSYASAFDNQNDILYGFVARSKEKTVYNLIGDFWVLIMMITIGIVTMYSYKK